MIEDLSAVWLPVTDMSAAVEFYRDTLGLSVQSAEDDWTMLRVGGQNVGLNARESPAGDGGAVLAFGVDDLDATVAKLRDDGVEFTGEISDHPWGRIIPFADPDGNDLQLYAPPA